MDSLIQWAMQLGVIPVLALYLVYRLHEQNRHLTELIEKQEKRMSRLVEIMITDLMEIRSQALKVRRKSHEDS